MIRVGEDKRNRIINIILPALLILGLIASTLIYQAKTAADIRRQAYSVLRDSAAEQATVFKESVHGRFNLLEAFAMELGLEPVYTDEKETQALCARMARITKATDFTALIVASPKGTAISQDGVRFNISDREYFQAAMRGENNITIVQSRLSGLRIFNFAVPVLSDGVPTGILMGSCSEQTFAALITPEAYSGNSYSFVTDKDGQYIIGTDNSFSAAPEKSKISDYIKSENYLSDAEFFRYKPSMGDPSEGKERYAICIPLGLNDWYLFNVVGSSVIDALVSKQLALGYAASAVTLMLAGGLFLFYMFSSRRKNAQLAREKERLRRSEELYRALEGFTDGIVFEGDIKTDTLKFNQSFYDKLGRYPDICKLSEASRPNNFIYEGDFAAWASFGRDLKNHVPTAFCEVRISDVNGSYTWFRLTYTLIYDENGEPYRLVGKMSDIDKSMRSMQRLLTRAETDSLTGVLNHEASRAHVDDFLKGAGQGGAHAFFIIDLDNFKKVNDIFGHYEGDRMLIKVTDELKNVFRSTDIIGRIGGDEFVVLVKNIANDSLLRLKAAELCEMLQFTHTSSGEGEKTELSVTSSVGVSRYLPDSKKGFDELYKEADEALYIAKGRGKSRYVIHQDVLEGLQESEEEAKPAPAVYTRNANIQLRTLLEHMDGGVLLLELGEKLRALYISPGFYTVTNTTPEHAKKYANDIMMLIRDEDKASFESAVRAGAEKGVTVDVAYRGIEWRGRTDTWWHLRGGLIDYPDSDYPVIAAVVTDVTTIKNASEELRLSKMRLSLALSQTNMVICELDISARELKAWDIKTEQYIPSASMLDAPDPAIADKRIHPDSAIEARAFFERIYKGEDEGSTVLKLKNLTDVYGWYKVNFKNVLSEDGKPYKAVGILESVPAIVDIKSRFDKEENFAAEFSYLLLATCKFNLTRNRVELLWASDKRVYGNGRIATYDDLYSTLCAVLPDDDERTQAEERFSHQALIKAFESGAQVTGEYFYTRLDGTPSWANYRVNLLLDPVTGDLYGFGYIRDVKKRKELELNLEGPVTHDSNTGAYTEHTARQFADTAIATSDNKDDFCGMLLIKLTGFGLAKEQIGYNTANQLLLSISRLLMIRFDSESVVSRLDDDCFTVFFPSIQSSEWLEETADEVLGILDAATIPLPSNVTYTLGAAIARLSDASYDKLIALSQESLENTKKQKRNRYTISIGVD